MKNMLNIEQTGEIYTISQLNREVRLLLEGNFSTLWVEGEISNFAAPHSGHWYFSLKDNAAQVRCAMFRPQNRQLDFLPKDGMQVLTKVNISLYEGRGEFQLLVDYLEDAGAGKLQKAFEALKKRLSAEGLFDTTHKKPLPSIPQCIGIITSPTGAALQDILHILKRRFPCVPVRVYPTLVQGELAAANIVNAIQTANADANCDVLILARGGGSLEDLWSFNEEIVARAIYENQIPLISGIGHEIDFTIADFVADVRAPTPSAAAEIVTPDKNELLLSITEMEKRLTRLLIQNLENNKQKLAFITQRLKQQHPQQRLREQIQQCDFFEVTLIRLQAKLLDNLKAKLQHAAGKLDALSPLATLKRGFTIATVAKNKTLLRTATQVQAGDKIKLKLMEGSVDCVVKE